MEDKFDKLEIFKIRQLINDVNIGMLVTTDDTGKLSSRPMSTSQVDDEGNIWFFTKDSSGKNHDPNKNNSVSLIYSHPGKNIYMHVNGLTTRIHDNEKINELNNARLKARLPNGMDDANLCLLKVNVNEIDFWNTTSRMDALPSIIRDLF